MLPMHHLQQMTCTLISMVCAISCICAQMICSRSLSESSGENLPVLDDALWGQTCQSLTFSIEEVNSTNPVLLAAPPRLDAHGTLFLEISNTQRGQARFRVTIDDDGSSPGFSPGTVRRGMPYVGRPGFSEAFATPTSREFAVCVKQVNQPPAFSVIPEIFAPSGTVERQHLLVFAVNITTGPGDVDQTLSWRLYGFDNALLFSAEPVLTVEDHWVHGSKVQVAGVLNVTLRNFAFGSSLFTIGLVDDGPARDGDTNFAKPQDFRLTVTTPNFEPSFELSFSRLDILEDSDEHTIRDGVIDARAGPAFEDSQVLTITLHSVIAVDSLWPAESLFSSFRISHSDHLNTPPAGKSKCKKQTPCTRCLHARVQTLYSPSSWLTRQV